MPRITEEFEHQAKKQSFRYDKQNQSKIVRQSGKLPDNSEEGLVVQSIGKDFLVKVSSNDEDIQLVECVTAGRIISENENSSMVAVGDKVGIIIPKKNKDGLSSGKIVSVHKRVNCFSRTTVYKQSREDILAANIDKALIFSAAVEPEYNRRFIDRLLITAELNLVEPAICINKIDLLYDEDLTDDFEIYKKLGIKVFFISALKEEGLEQISNFIKDSVTLLCGASGTGKSTLINGLSGKSIQKVTDISDKTFKGKHTTSATRMIEFGWGGNLIDTPGLREFALWGLTKNDAALYYHEFDEFSSQCRFTPCTHTHEPECVVKDAYEKGLVDAQRYESYLNIFDSLEE
ncbi:MAG: ribosome small subunit-dependent GTPase A [Ignavibacteriae bacterium]|nr:ribosome small subunit-dependent GTPase A [Ignavibacteriota bacterium]